LKKVRFQFKLGIKINFLDLIPNIVQGQARKLSSGSGDELQAQARASSLYIQAQARFFVISSPARISSGSKLGVPELLCIIIYKLLINQFYIIISYTLICFKESFNRVMKLSKVLQK
jgi:hypothetical protein